MDNQTKISIVLFILIIGLLLYNFLVITRKTITNTKWYIKKFGKKIPCIICGHETYLIDKINAHGKSFAFEIPLNNGTTHFCHECLSLLAIECAWCDRQILFEDKTIVYQAMDICLVPKNIKLYFTDPVYIFGCNHEKCVGRHIAEYHGFFPIKKKGKQMTAMKMVVLGKKLEAIQKEKLKKQIEDRIIDIPIS